MKNRSGSQAVMLSKDGKRTPAHMKTSGRKVTAFSSISSHLRLQIRPPRIIQKAPIRTPGVCRILPPKLHLP